MSIPNTLDTENDYFQILEGKLPYYESTQCCFVWKQIPENTKMIGRIESHHLMYDFIDVSVALQDPTGKTIMWYTSHHDEEDELSTINYLKEDGVHSLYYTNGQFEKVTQNSCLKFEYNTNKLEISDEMGILVK
jgi:hypothetical protein